jgi:hypothetical protein
VRVVDTARWLLARAAWLALAALIALGGAGIVASMDHAPGTAGRPELTWAADRAAVPALDAATDRLEQLSNGVDTLGTTARLALAQVVAGNLDGLNATIASGTVQLAAVQSQAQALETSLVDIPGIGPGDELRLSPGILSRYQELAKTRNLTDGLEADWTAFTGRALDAASLTGMLTEHDRQTAAAAKAGAAGHYKAALAELDKSDATMKRARALRDRLAPTTDVSTLTTWLDLNAAYDKALRNLYQSLVDANGRVTSAVRQAFGDEQAARQALPGDTRGLVVIMAEIAQGGLNQAVISIEQARGSLSTALDVQRRFQGDGGAEPSPGVEASPSTEASPGS